MEEWESFLKNEEMKPKKKEGILGGMFGKSNNIQLKLQFEL